MVYKVIIIGSGPAGLTAGIYAGRSKLEPLIIEGNMPGGQLTTTTKVENWPSYISIDGPELMKKIREQAEVCGAHFVSDEVSGIDVSGEPYKVFTRAGKTFETQSIIIASGAVHKKLGCTGEQEYWGKGVSVCATCDAPFMQEKEVVIVGGGNSAVTEAEYLTKFASKITIVQALDALTATDPIKDKVLADPKITIIYNSTVIEMKGDGEHVTHVVIENQEDKSKTTVPAFGVFIAIGLIPSTKIFQGQIELDENGYIILKHRTQTNVAGVFAAGDVSDPLYKQAITSSGDGCKAALDCEIYLTGKISVSY
jgi:thioredoxin reductase (NADPH)